MAKKMAQFRYYGDNDSRNYPSSINLSRNILDGYYNITQMGIQAPPDTQFILNDSQYEINVGNTGIYEIDLQDYGFIQSLVFTKAKTLLTNDNDRILIDIIFDGGGEI